MALTLQTVVQGITNLAEDDVMDVLALRLGIDDSSSSFVESLLEVDEAVDLLEKGDVDLLRAEQKGACTRLEGREVFAKEYKEAKQAQRAQKASGYRRSKKPARSDVPFTILHSEAREFLPPKSSIWRGLTRNSWHGHREGRKRVSASWALWGESGAMRQVLKLLWGQHLEMEGMEVEDCPFTGLFDEVPSASAGSKASGSKG